MRIPLFLLRCRRWVQVLVLAGLWALPWLNAEGWRSVMGNFYAFDLGGIPFADPLGVAQTLVSGHIPGWRLWVGAGLTLGLAGILGRVFCGWICPYGLLSEWLWALRGKKTCRAQENRSWTVRIAIAVIGLGGTVLLGVPVLNAVSGQGLLSLAPQMLSDTWWDALVLLTLAPVLGGVIVETITGTRWWCRYLCPQSLLLMVASLPGRRMAVRWTAAACCCKGKDIPCFKACSLGLRPRSIHGPTAAHCVQCGDCVQTCADHGKALELRIK